DFDGAEDTGDPVESTAPVDRVGMRAEHDLSPAEATAQASDHVAGSVDPGLESGLLHQSAREVASGDVLFAQCPPGPAWPGGIGEGGEFCQFGREALAHR